MILLEVTTNSGQLIGTLINRHQLYKNNAAHCLGLIVESIMLIQSILVLLKFRSRLYAALRDVKKMHNSVWLKDKKVHLHRFLWRDDPKDEIGVFAVVSINIGDKPAGCIAQVAMRATANLPQFASMVAEQ